MSEPCTCGSCCAWAEVLAAIAPIIQADLARAYRAKYAPPDYDQGGVIPPGLRWFRNDSGEDEQVIPRDPRS